MCKFDIRRPTKAQNDEKNDDTEQTTIKVRKVGAGGDVRP